MALNDKDLLLLKKTLTYANGYRELGMSREALEELSNLPENLAYLPQCLGMRLAVLIDAQDWPAAECAAKDMLLREPDNPGHLVNLAFATRRSKSIGEAESILLKAVDRFPNEAIIHYNLGCYACLSHELEIAKARLVKAFSLDPKYLDTAKSDQDLDDLQPWLDGLEFA